MKELDFFLTADERGIDQTNQPPGDCNLYQNAPIRGRIPQWWLEEGTPEQVASWQDQLDSGEAVIE